MIDRQQIFDAIREACETHAPGLADDVRIAIASDAALKIAKEAREAWRDMDRVDA